MSDVQRAPSLGATGGLPGTNAAPEAREPSSDDLDLLQPGDLRTTPTDPIADRDVDDLVDEQAGRETRAEALLAEAETGVDAEPGG